MKPMLIAAQIKARKPFHVATVAEQKMVLAAKDYLVVALRTKACRKGGWLVEFIAEDK